MWTGVTLTWTSMQVMGASEVSESESEDEYEDDQEQEEDEGNLMAGMFVE